MRHLVKRASPSYPTGSTSDIAFLLLIFFLAITTIGNDKGIRMTLPEKDAVVSKPALRLDILIGADGSIHIDDRTVSLSELGTVMRSHAAKSTDLLVSVATSRQTRYRYYIAVLDVLNDYGIRRISIADP
jgi:biopolymer transport protein ExbD